MNVIIASDIELPSKPKYGSPCNGCGFCCSEEICEIGVIAYPDAVAPCPGLVMDRTEQRTLCSLVRAEAESGMAPMISIALGVGRGCDTSDD